MAMHIKQRNWWLLGILSAVCVAAGVAVALVAVYLPRIAPAGGGGAVSSSSSSWASAPEESSAAVTVITTETTTTTETTVTTTTTTQAKYRKLSVTSHKTKTTTDEPFTVFRGTSDPDSPLYINGKEVKRDTVGVFAVEMALKPGENTFVFSHKGKDTAYTVVYNYVVLRSCTPENDQRYKSGSSFSVSVKARVGSTVTATFNGKTITLEEYTGSGEYEEVTKEDTFATYMGSFTLPSDNATDKNMGKVTFKATCNGQTATLTSGAIVCEKAVMPVIAEIVSFSAETFDGNTSDDTSRPTNNYLPKGTVDYVVGRAYYGDKEYLRLRCGRRVYVKKDLSPTKEVATVTKQYAGTLPETNSLSVASITETDRCTRLLLNTAWKAPFLLDLLPQTYTNPAKQDYTVSDVTCEYVQITFCYAASFKGTVVFDPNNPLFSRATVSRSGDNTVLRLYLRRVGQFYGWDASYNEAGQLEFYFLHPAQAQPANNAYGADLSGIRIMLDVGHSPKVVGAFGLDPLHPEGERNLYLARLLKAELESMGAIVTLNRDDKTELHVDQRCLALKKAKPDLCIAIHHDSNSSARPNGFGAFHSTLFSARVAEYIYKRTMAANIYSASAENNRNRLAWHYYFVARMSDCPVVLTENGFMSSPLDHAGIVSHTVNVQKARAIARGVADYFLSIRIPDRVPIGTPTTTSATTTAGTSTVYKDKTTVTGKTTTATVTEDTTMSTETTSASTDSTSVSTEDTTIPTEDTTPSTEETSIPTEDTSIPTEDTTIPTEETTESSTTAETPTDVPLPTEA